MENKEVAKIAYVKENEILKENLRIEKEKNVELQSQLDSILNSRSYKFIRKIKKILRKG